MLQKKAQNRDTVQRLSVVGLSGVCLLLLGSVALASPLGGTVPARAVSDPALLRPGLPELLLPETGLRRGAIRPHEETSAARVEPASSAAGEFSGTLTVTTEPAGATVYVGGQPRGETPVEIVGLPAGEHRITIVKDGYIDNSRVLRLAPERNESLNVALTPGVEGAEATELQEESGEGGGGGWWKWAALAGGGGAAAYLLLPKNKPPVAGPERHAGRVRHGRVDGVPLRRRRVVRPRQRPVDLLVELRRRRQRVGPQCYAQVRLGRYVHRDADRERRQGAGDSHQLRDSHPESRGNLHNAHGGFAFYSGCRQPSRLSVLEVDAVGYASRR